jgi:hypothetical protein
MVKNNYVKRKRINDALRLLDNSFNIKPNVVKLNIHNSLHHELAKCKKAYELIKEGKQIVTEAIFKSGGRADILVPEEFRVYEIMSSETEEEALDKKVRYPAELDIIFLKDVEVLKND